MGRKIAFKTSYSLFLTVILAAVFCFMPAAAFAVDTDYSGYVDPATNEPMSQEDSSANGGTRALISGNIYYDWTAHDFAYPVSGSLTEVHSNVMDGMIVSSPVTVKTGGDVSVSVYCDGDLYSGDITNIRDVGSYAVSYDQGGSVKRLFNFQIVGSSTNSISSFVVPDNFYISSATLDGEDVYEGRYTLSMEEEGLYEILYRCGPTDIGYTFSVTIDRTAPSLSFKGSVDSKQRVHSALYFYGLEQGDSIYLLKDGAVASPTLKSDGSGYITDSGSYIMRVYDAAGNMKEYNFTIMMYLNSGSWLFFLLLIAAIAAVVIYIVMKRKHLKIG